MPWGDREKAEEEAACVRRRERRQTEQPDNFKQGGPLSRQKVWGDSLAARFMRYNKGWLDPVLKVSQKDLCRF